MMVVVTNLATLRDEEIPAAREGFRGRISPLIRVRGGEIMYASTLGEKRALLEGSTEDDVLVWPWGGKYSTTVFGLSLEQAQALA
jgi:hypothetical protein